MANDKILVIDDSRVIRNMVRDMLPEGNFQVLEAKDGIEGMNLIRQERPNLIMLDFLLPRMSGWEVYQEIQNNSELQSIPLIMMSGRKEELTEKLTEPFEFFEFIEKPFEKKDLNEAIKAAIVKARRRSPGAPMVTAASTAAAAAAAASALEVHALNEKVAKMQTEITLLKKQISQIVAFLKQKVK
ncbi:chemotaxis protein CheY [Neosynechococcus sphagnicola sy1]|uniref:Chemotaxis protein CheY n=1 Tax=Neosynechococcus sphagnicola sy1 TaxID=1497020 RepID=A0A098TNI8_9CYAN|nr:response regulator [Neosynechococcus sphagnicola]KGF73826.1 chemotaxis protein CheY [Neosynechococcus sphagnicola sy1]